MARSTLERPRGKRANNVRQLRPDRPPESPLIAYDTPDLGYIFTLACLISIGMIMMYSTIAVDGETADLARSAQWLGLGVASMVAAAYMPARFWRRITPLFLLACVVALASLHIPGNPLAISVKGATRWLQVPGGQVQPSEFAKLAFMLFAARLLERRGGKGMRSQTWFAYLGVLGVLMAMIYKQPDLGTALVLGAAAYCLLILSGAQWRYLAGGALLAVVAVGLLAWNTPHQKARLLSYRDPWAPEYRQEDGHQVIQSYAAMARGGLWGVGLGQSLQKLDNRLPESKNDFVFAILAEEMGMVRAGGVLLLFGFLAWRGFGIAARAPDRYSGLLAAGITCWVTVQSFMNIAVVTGSIPNTGVPLPFVSAGGSSLLALLTGTGIVIGVSRQRAVKRPAPAPATVTVPVPPTSPRRR